ncbi:unnamed protein product [Toxocara canis]|uniref:RNase H domain-containing protein n=1 Tax=Toxocara canis TaxID=6265 RepID=A0A183V0M3_TOXCA|nr:unnamed protein product [Toxocara canis]
MSEVKPTEDMWYDVEKFWSLESIGINDALAVTDNDRDLQMFDSSITRSGESDGEVKSNEDRAWLKQLVDEVRANVYVDNVMIGANTAEEAVRKYKALKQIFLEASMNLREWLSNDEEVNGRFEESDRAEGGLSKILGIGWNVHSDSLELKLKDCTRTNAEVVTKRKVLNQLTKIYEAVGVEFRYVKTEKNPADIATRGAAPEVLENYQLWWKGPEWLTEPRKKWPQHCTFDGDDAAADVDGEEQCQDLNNATSPAVHLVLQTNAGGEGEPFNIIQEIAKRVSSW